MPACSVRSLLATLVLAAATPALAQPTLKSDLVRRWQVPEATQGATADATHFYAIANSRIAKYDRATGKKLAEWSGEPARYPHINACSLQGKEMFCAASNYPAVPQASSIEVFDPARMVHLRTISLGEQIGSLTWVDRRDGAWWAGFANYDNRGGEPGRDHRYTALVKFDDQWRRMESWLFPKSVLDRMAPYSTSGGAWGADGRLYVTGHDRTEAYVLSLPKGGATLDHVATIEVAAEGQSIGFDRSAKGVLFGITRQSREVLEMRLPEVR
jgi:hypothetical protein